jgi:hypothetical protein
VVAFVDGFTVVRPGWREALEGAVADGADVVTGPVLRGDGVGFEADAPERKRIAGRAVSYFDGGNVAFDADLLGQLDGFDEYLRIGGSRDAAHRIARLEGRTDWAGALTAERSADTHGDVGYGWKYRSLAYRLGKNYGLRPTVLRRLAGHAGRDGVAELRRVAGGESEPSRWLGAGRDVTVNIAVGLKDGLLARRKDGKPRRNPRGRSARTDRAVTVYDYR